MKAIFPKSEKAWRNARRGDLVRVGIPDHGRSIIIWTYYVDQRGGVVELMSQKKADYPRGTDLVRVDRAPISTIKYDGWTAAILDPRNTETKFIGPSQKDEYCESVVQLKERNRWR